MIQRDTHTINSQRQKGSLEITSKHVRSFFFFVTEKVDQAGCGYAAPSHSHSGGRRLPSPLCLQHSQAQFHSQVCTGTGVLRLLLVNGSHMCHVAISSHHALKLQYQQAIKGSSLFSWQSRCQKGHFTYIIPFMVRSSPMLMSYVGASPPLVDREGRESTIRLRY